MDEHELELVRRGFDPAQVQQLVGSLAAELKTMAAANDRLRTRLAELEASPRAASSSAPAGDVFAHWSNETNALLDAARSSIARVTEKATADAAAAMASGEMAANTIRQRAQLDADQILTDARRKADEIALEAQRHAAAVTAAAEADKAAREAEAQARVDQARAQVDALAAALAGLRDQRSAMSRQLSVARGHLAALIALVDAADDTGVDVTTTVAPSADVPVAGATAVPTLPATTWPTSATPAEAGSDAADEGGDAVA